ncbi:MAG TPA: translocation/assembly module TamB domain-containing protein, partial [Ohtaekwangia sp.]|nr:translocation/assembly module TamB domain-containing protein [Ohtaekwangia sp.]
FDSLTFRGATFIDNNADLTVSKISDSTSVLAMLTINSGGQSLTKNFKSKNLLAEAIWNKSHIDFGLDADQDGQPNYVRLKGAVDFMRDSTVISMAPSALKILARDWTFSPDNFVAIAGSDWTFHDLSLINAEQSVSLNGKLSRDPSRILSLTVSKLDLSLFDAITDQKFKGVVDARTDVSNYFQDPAVQNNILIQGLTVNEFLIGNIRGENRWDTLQNKFDINFFVDRNDKRTVNLTGHYKPSDKKSPLNIAARLDNAELKILEPFLKDIFSQIGGRVSGDFTITGLLNAPQIQGEGQVPDGQLMVNYLKTMYRFTGTVGLTPTSIYFKEIDLTDVFRNKGQLQGEITHRNFYSMFVNLDATFRTFQVLNTTVKDNSLFYGQAYATGDLKFYGPVANLKITSTARTERNTRVYIPIGGVSSVEKKDFITFVNFRDTTFTREINNNLSNRVDLTGISIDLNLDVTPDAYCEIIFDQKAGDIIRGRGNGDLKLQLDTKGDFNMFGPFEFTEGWYNFTLYDIINKEFEIQRGSRISWYGDPYQAVMNINASYNQLASLGPLIIGDEVAAQSSQIRRKYPVQVLLQLEGQMLSPEFAFDIIAEDLPQSVPVDNNRPPINLDLVFTAFKNKLDEQELKRQVFSLIVLRRFSPPDALGASGSDVGSSLSELLSNQLSNWMSQVDENLVIDVDLGSFDENAFNTFQLRLSYTFLNGRLRVTGDGTFNNAANNPANVNQQNPSSVAGDWTVDYMLTPDGKLRVKMYSRTNNNTVLSSVNNQSSITTGASLIHTQNFDEIRDLWRSARERKKRDQQKTDANKEAIKEEDAGGE